MSAQQFAEAVLQHVLDAGGRELVLCPGSRNAALSFAAWAADRDGALRLHTRIDERTAGFLALGLAKGSHAPVAVVVTSGTAAANLHPAVLEAAHAGERLVVLTADRPASLRGTGANQTTDQAGLYGDAAAWLDAATPADLATLPELLRGGGPVHVNLQFSEPLVPDDLGPSPLRPADPPGRRRWQRPEGEPLPPGPRTVVVAGDDAGPPARVLAQEGDWPLLAEPSSGSRTGTHPVRHYRLLLGTALGEAVERVVVYGHPTLSRPVSALLGRADVEVVSVPPGGRWPRRPFPVDREYDALRVEAADDPGWREAWVRADREVGRRLAAERGDMLTPYAVAEAVSAAVPPGGQLYVGASNPVRDLDLMALAGPVGERRKVLANRGLAGIDGTLSSALGAALTRPGARNLALVGDVTFLHDATALVIGPDEPRPDLTVVVVNDDGGSIFATLEQGAPAYAAAFERVFGTPHHVDLAALCQATSTPHWAVSSLAELRHALASPAGGIEVVEVRCRRDDRRTSEARWHEVAREVVGEVVPESADWGPDTPGGG